MKAMERETLLGRGMPQGNADATGATPQAGTMPLGRGPAGLAFFWGLAEATFFFIVPDVYLSRLVLASRRRCLRAMLWALLGALLGGLLMYRWGALWPEAATRCLDQVPAISPQMLARAGRQLQHRGASALFLGALMGYPYKIYAMQAGHLGLALPLFILASLAARLARFFLVCALVDFLGRALLGCLSQRTRQAAHLIGWTLFYLFYFARMPN